MRARLALVRSGVQVELREILLRDKPDAFLRDSRSGTVPCLRTDGQIIDESLDIMIWALKQNDTYGLLKMPQQGWDLIAENDGPFKAALDRTKYPTRFDGIDASVEREKASMFLKGLDARLSGQDFLFGDVPTIADDAVLPFIRQFAHIDREWFDAQDWPNLISWLDQFLASHLFSASMQKYPLWSEGDAQVMLKAQVV